MLAKLMEPPDPDGTVSWITQSQVDEGFPGLRGLSRFPHVLFYARTIDEYWIDPDNRHLLKAPLYCYTVEVHLRARVQERDKDFVVVRCWDAEGKTCRKQTRNDKYILAPYEETYFGGPLEEGIWKAIITGESRDQIPFPQDALIWRKITPYLLEMSQAPEMRAMEGLYFPGVKHHELYTEPYEEGKLSFLTEAEEVNEKRWQEILHWAAEEWKGGGYPLEKGNSVLIYASRGSLSLRIETYKHKPEEPRTLYSIRINPPRETRLGFGIVFSQDVPIPETLDGFLTLYVQRHGATYVGNPSGMRTVRRRIKEINFDEGYPSLAEVYAYVIQRLRTPPEHHELYTEPYEESFLSEGIVLNVEEAMSKASSEKRFRLLAQFLQWIKAFKPDFRHWANLEEVWITADNPVWKVGGGGIIAIADKLNAYFPLLVNTEYSLSLPLTMSNSRYNRNIDRVADINKLVTNLITRHTPESITNFAAAKNWKGPVFLVQLNQTTLHETTLHEATRTLRYRFADPYAVPSVESLAGVHSFRKVTPNQVSDVEIFTRAAEEMGLDNPVGRAAAIRMGTMGYADSVPEYKLLRFRQPEFREKINQAGDDFLSLFITEHGELYTTSGGYGEAVDVATAFDAMIWKWNSFPDSESELSKQGSSFPYCTFRRRMSETPNLSVNFTYWPESPAGPPVVNISYWGLARNGLSLDQFPEAVGDDFLNQLEDSETRHRLRGVKPATAAHWEKQFLLGINLEKKVPESAFPKEPVAELPPYFDKFRAAPATEADLHLVIDTDLSLLGE